MISTFPTRTPESRGISSYEIRRMLEGFDALQMHTHSILISRGDDIVAEGYYHPFHEHFLHRMYSASKTFVAVAVGVAVSEGLIRMDDRIADYFPEYTADADEQYRATTVRDMLQMKSNVASCVFWWGRFDSRVRAYYTHPTEQVPGSLYYYDSIGSFMLGCIIERLTGKTFLDYLKEKVLLDIGFSRDSYVLYEPGGHTVGDSGVICTARDLWLLARLIMKRGAWHGRQYIDRTYMEEMLTVQSYNHHNTGMTSWDGSGYGYLIWHTGKDTFTITGLGDQLAVCNLRLDTVCVVTADNQGNKPARHIMMHELNHHFFPHIQDGPLPEDPVAYEALCSFLSSRRLVAQQGLPHTPLADQISGVTYEAQPNRLDIRTLTLTLTEDGGTLTLERKDSLLTVPFGLCHNRLSDVTLGPRAKADAMGFYEEGAYRSALSAAWVDASTFVLLVQVIDTYFGAMKLVLAYKGDTLCVHIVKSGQYVFEGIEGRLMAKRRKNENN